MLLLLLLLALGFAMASGILIAPGSSLTPSSSTRFWNSSSGEFGVGFFKTPESPPNTNYVGILFLSGMSSTSPALVTEPEVVWIANRDRPASDNSSLQFSPESGLVLIDHDSGQTIWRAPTSPSQSPSAELLDTGNLVIYSSRNSSGGILWQSFDSPTHTLLPGQSLRLSATIASWRSRSDPSPGAFVLTVSAAMSKLRLLHLSPDTTEFEYWSQLETRGLVFSDELNSTIGTITMGWIMNNTSPEFRSQCTGLVSSTYRNFTKRLTLDPDGNLRYYARARSTPGGSSQWLILWRALFDSCYVHNYCGSVGMCNFDPNPRPECPLPEEPNYCRCPAGFRNSSEPQLGCQPSEPIRCVRSPIFSRVENSGYDLSNPIAREVVAGESNCRESCSQSANCSCKAAVFSKSSSECWLLGSLVNGNFSSAQESLVAFVRAPGEVKPRDSGAESLKIGLSIAGAVMGMALIIFAGVILAREIRLQKTIRHGILDIVGEFQLKRYRYEYLKLITDGFKRVIGQGGYGVVYMGITPKTQEKLAVKLFKVRVAEDPDADSKTFMVETESLASLNHANVVRLLGFCTGGPSQERALVFEYVANGSLDKHLFQRTTSLTSLRTRIDILIGAAKGIEYFHKYSGRKVVHRDIKPGNILLDENFEAKVADFGMAKIVQAAQSSVSTTFTLAGTLTYKAPESTMIGAAITVKADIFSFGVTCMETITGKKMVFTAGQRESMGGVRTMLFRSVLGLMEKDCYEDLLDERVELEGGEVRDVVRVMNLAAWCMQDDPVERPDMEVVAMVLKGEKLVQEPSITSLPRYIQDDHHLAEIEERSVAEDMVIIVEKEFGSQFSKSSDKLVT